MAASNWDQRYLEGSDRWELGRPAPPLEAFLRTDSRAPQPPGRVLVPGCGRGHEAALLADLGYEVIGLDFSSEAIQRTEESMVQIVLGRAPQAIGSFVGVARGEQTRFLGSNTTSSRQTMHTAAPELASLFDGSSAGELISELATRGLQQLIELELAAFIVADWHERTEERLRHRNGYRPRTLTTQMGDLALQIPELRAGSFLPSILEPLVPVCAWCRASSRSGPGPESRWWPRGAAHRARRPTPWPSGADSDRCSSTNWLAIQRSCSACWRATCAEGAARPARHGPTIVRSASSSPDIRSRPARSERRRSSRLYIRP